MNVKFRKTFKRKLIKLKVNQVMRLQEMNQLRPTLVYDIPIKKGANWITMGWVNSTQTKEQYHEPRTFEEASMCPERDKWMEAMEREMASLKANDMYYLVELPKDRKVVGSKWVYKRKVKADGSVERFKSTLH